MTYAALHVALDLQNTAVHRLVQHETCEQHVDLRPPAADLIPQRCRAHLLWELHCGHCEPGP
eukprot:6614119-Pyramimonas_sp.AAC.1